MLFICRAQKSGEGKTRMLKERINDGKIINETVKYQNKSTQEKLNLIVE